MKTRSIIIMMIMSAFVFTANAESFMLKHLEVLSRAVGITLPQKAMADADYDSEYSYKGKPVRVRTNYLGDISHIGYKLFDSEFANGFYARPLLDLIERYALEMDIDIPDVDRAEMESRRNVKFLEGDASMLKELTPEVSVFINEKERRNFSVEWETKGQKVSMLIPANYQTLIGANAMELEQILLRDVKRIPKHVVSGDLPQNWADGNISSSDNMVIVDYGSYFSDMIRSEIYLEKKGRKSSIMIDLSKPLQSVKNILLTGHFHDVVPVELTFDMYGGKKTNLKITLQQLLEYFNNEGCKLYIGIKSYDENMVSATLFAVNKTMAYNHTMPVVFPLSILKEGKGVMKATLYAYTPLQNITEKFFNY